MYNSEIKEQFIAQFTTGVARRNAAVVMFNALEPYEKAWGADICTRSAEELQPVVTEIVGFRTSSKKLRLNILRSYVKWCLEHGVPGACDGLLQIESLGLEKLKRQMVANPQHLQRYLDCICDEESEQTVDCTYRCYFWLAYGGMNEETVLDVVTSDVHLDEMVVRHNGEEYPIYREAIRAFKDCMTLTQFRVNHPNYDPNKPHIKDRAPGDTLLRGIGDTESKSIYAMRVTMSKKAKKAKVETASEDDSLDLNLSFFRVWLSGLFYRMYEAERAGMPVDFMDIAEQKTDGTTQSSGRDLIGEKKRRIAGDYMKDYLRWKEAYSI